MFRVAPDLLAPRTSGEFLHSSSEIAGYIPSFIERNYPHRGWRLVGLRFRQPEAGAPGFKVSLFIDKNAGLEEDVLPPVSKIVSS
jgi:hypothetical protein